MEEENAASKGLQTRHVHRGFKHVTHAFHRLADQLEKRPAERPPAILVSRNIVCEALPALLDVQLSPLCPPDPTNEPDGARMAPARGDSGGVNPPTLPPRSIC